MPRGGTKGGTGASTAATRHVGDIQVGTQGEWVRDHRFRFATFAQVLAQVEVDPLRAPQRHLGDEGEGEGGLPGQGRAPVEDEYASDFFFFFFIYYYFFFFFASHVFWMDANIHMFEPPSSPLSQSPHFIYI
jgi:hypothetical protein